MIIAKINAKCTMKAFHPSLPFRIHINHEENNWVMEGSLIPCLCAQMWILDYFKLNMLKYKQKTL